MARISGMILGIALLILISSLASPAGAWDSDDDDAFRRRGFHFDGDDDDGFRRRGFHFDRDDDDDFRFRGQRRLFGGSVFVAPRRSFYDTYPERSYPPVPQQQYYAPVPQQRYYAPPQNYYPPTQEQPIAPEPLPPEALRQGGYQPQLTVPPLPPVGAPLHERPGQFVDGGVPLYPHVRVKDAEEAPAFGVHRILAVRNPDPRIPGCVYVRVFVPPGPCKELKVEDRGAKVELEYEDFEIKIESERGVITVEYDD